MCLIIILVFKLFLIKTTTSYILTTTDFNKIAKFLGDDLLVKYGSDKSDFSDVITQVYDKKENATKYHRGDAKQPVFICFDENQVGMKSVVLKRGQDYMSPEERNTFIVLRQRTGGKDYNIHSALITQLGGAKKDVVWTDARIEQQAKAKSLNMLGRSFRRSRPKNDTSGRIFVFKPHCEWLATVLFCETKTTVPAKARKFAPQIKTIKIEKGKDNTPSKDGDKTKESAENDEESPVKKPVNKTKKKGPKGRIMKPKGRLFKKPKELKPNAKGRVITKPKLNI